ncbi:hypothetical protein BCR32DRAFT_288461 [Anaeromyces robustus]|uniref:Uncharacterized protein n=1 Tax=Anaeromyces robustus TaxID=1754192 RepID=A0A1Y1UUH4_9FUNG|nr:hypothetical protein BCR32DRAFT_288461 [Anaeromyces robustus]|eukprot:ORX41682.1 hypothetical protein BCR32DRAFT_288461 [Anaeromyces robustus]
MVMKLISKRYKNEIKILNVIAVFLNLHQNLFYLKYIYHTINIILPQSNENLLKRSNTDIIPINSKIVNPLCPVSNYYAVGVYLSESLVEEIKALPNVTACEKSEKVNPATYYDLKQIQNETKWNDVSVQDNSRYTQNNTQKYDNNYYYPSSAGKGIDIYFIDLGLQLNHPDFDTYKGTSDEQYIDNRDGKYECNTQPMAFHGNMVASVAGGTLYGVAKKANLHMLDVDLTFGNEIIALDYIFKNGKPHKTIISISMIGKYLS